MKSKMFFALVLVVFVNLFSVALADNADDAKNSANAIMTEMSKGNYQNVWDNHMSQWFKSKLTKDSFLANLSLGRSMLGARINSKLVDVSYTANDPASGYQGDIYALTYTNKYHGATVYERVVVINEDGNGFKLSGFFANPAK